MESRKGEKTREKEIRLAKRGAMMNEKIVGIRLKQLRERIGLSQAKFAKVLGGVSQPVIARYETGDCFPSYSVLIKIADYFNLSTDYLLGRTDSIHALHCGVCQCILRRRELNSATAS